MPEPLERALDEVIRAHTAVIEAAQEESHRIARARRLEDEKRTAEAGLNQGMGGAQ